MQQSEWIQLPISEQVALEWLAPQPQQHCVVFSQEAGQTEMWLQDKGGSAHVAGLVSCNEK